VAVSVALGRRIDVCNRYLFLPQAFESVIQVIAKQQMASLARDVSPLLAIFPDLRFHLTWLSHTVDSVDVDDILPKVIVDQTLHIHGAVDSIILHELLTTLPLRMGPSIDTDAESITDGFLHVRWHKHGQILDSTLMEPVRRYLASQISGLSLHVEFGKSTMENRRGLKDVSKILLEHRGEWSIRMEEGSSSV
jgi:hypothetical protein